MRRILFEPRAFDDFTSWADLDRETYRRIVQLIKDARRSPFSGVGKPEPLRGPAQGYWSRRITEEHRLVYKVTDEVVVIVACRNHYE